MPDNPAPSHFSTSQYKSTLFETKMACIENMSRIQHRQLNYRSHTCHNCDMLIMKFDLWWPELSEVPQNPVSIPSATSLAREWLAEALFSTQHLDPIWLVSWWVGVPGRDSGMTLLSRSVSDSWSLGISDLDIAGSDPSDSWLLITEDTKHGCFCQGESPRKVKLNRKDPKRCGR